MCAWGEEAEWPGFSSGVNEVEYQRVQTALDTAKYHNGWFDRPNVCRALKGLGEAMTEEKLGKWLANTSEEQASPKVVGLILAGNIPLVGFHDMLTSLVTGHAVQIKASAKDRVLMEAMIDVLELLEPSYRERIELLEGKLDGYEAVIATGSNNSAEHFRQYFTRVPHIIRNNRNSVAVITGNETEAELNALGADIFDFYGLGCRNVSKLYIHQDFNTDRFFEAIFDRSDVVNHHKYANNYDYIKSVWLLNSEQLLDNGFLLLKEEETLAAPTGSLYTERYTDKAELEAILKEKQNEIQCIVGHGYVPFGNSQRPELWDYADGVNTLEWLQALHTAPVEK